MSQKVKRIFLLAMALAASGGVLFWYLTTSKPDTPKTNTQPSTHTPDNMLEGTLKRVDCSTAGAGCAELVVRLADGSIRGLVVNQDVTAHIDKKVRLTGRYVKTFGAGGPSFFEVQTIQTLE